jgi:hypothetical protein
VEALDHAVAGHRVGERHHRHAGVMREIRLHHHARAPRAGGVAGAVGVINRFVEAEIAEQACLGETAQIARAARRIDEHGERRRVRRDDDLVAKAALEAESGHAKRLVLIVAVAIDGRVGAFGNAPWHSSRRGVVHLPAHHHPARFVEQRVGEAAHHEQRHQVLEHRGAPRQQHR